jgi:hypothetical protein
MTQHYDDWSPYYNTLVGQFEYIHLESLINDLDAASDVSDCAHCVLWLDGRFYDSEWLEGTPDVRTIATRVSRESFLTAKAST